MSGLSVFMLVTAVVTGALTAIFAVLYRIVQTAGLLSAAISFGTVFYHFAMRLLVGAIVPKNPNSERRCFRSRRFEPRLYAALRVKHWKKYVPAYDPKLYSLKHNSTAQIITNTCRAELTHTAIAVLSFLPLLAIPVFHSAGVFVTTSVIAALLDTCLVILQRYNRPRLERIAEKENRIRE